MNHHRDSVTEPDYRADQTAPDRLGLIFSGDLTAPVLGRLWKRTARRVKTTRARRLTLDVSAVGNWDSAGISLLDWLVRQAQARQIDTEIVGLPETVRPLLERFEKTSSQPDPPAERLTVIEAIGRQTLAFFQDLHEQIAFAARVGVTGLKLAARPWAFRWRDFFDIAEHAGFRAVGIVSLLGLLFGLIMAFSSAMPLKQFGVEIYVADLVAIALVRVLGPFITAVIVAGRTGSAFAAELGTMKVNNEIDALEVMNLDPVAFLVLPRVCATTAMTPLLAIAANLLGLVGAAVVILSLGYPLVIYTEHVQSILSVPDVLVGLVKALVYGGLIGTVGCLRGLQTQIGAGAVGISTTRAVVSSIILLVITEGLFSVLLYYLDI